MSKMFLIKLTSKFLVQSNDLTTVKKSGESCVETTEMHFLKDDDYRI